MKALFFSRSHSAPGGESFSGDAAAPAAVPMLGILAWSAFSIARFTGLGARGELCFAWTGTVLLHLAVGAGVLPALFYALRWGLRNSPSRSAGARLAADVLRPVHFLWVLPICRFVLYPLGAPLALLGLANPTLILLVAILGMATALAAGLPLLFPRLSARLEAWGKPGWIAFALFLLCFTLYKTETDKEDRKNLLVGDEPHYMFIMESLKRNKTANLRPLCDSQEALGEGVTRITPHASPRSQNGGVYSVHHVGLPILLIGPHLANGYTGVMVFFNVVTALLVANLFLLSVELTGRRRLSFWIALLMGLTPPLGFYFRLIYPDPVAALFLVYAFRRLCLKPASWAQALAAGVCLAFLPWLHVKYVLFSVALALCMLCRRVLRLSQTVATLLILGLSGVAMMFFFHHAYGSWLPNAQYQEGEKVLSAFLPRGLLGLFLDRDHGLLAFSPYLLFAFPGWIRLIRREKRISRWLGLLLVPSLLVLASHWMWWGGPCPAGRFMLPLIPFFAPPLVLALGACRSRWGRAGWLLCAAFSLFTSYLGLEEVRKLGMHLHVAYETFTALEAYPALPWFFVHWRDSVLASTWKITAAIGAVALLFGLLAMWRAKTPDKLEKLSPAALLLFVLLPGCLSLAQHAFEKRDDPSFVEKNVRLARFRLPGRALTEPLQEAGADIFRKAENLAHPIHTEIRLKANTHRIADEESVRKAPHVLWGPYCTLCPGDYRVAYNLTYRCLVGDGDRPACLLQIVALGGRRTLLKKTYACRQGNLENRVLDLRLARAEFGCEFTAQVLTPLDVKANGVTVSYHLGPARPIGREQWANE